MRLTLSLFKIVPPPPRFRGKYRIVKKPAFKDLLSLRHDLEREENNMLILRHPYLTSEQSYGHMKEKNSKKPTIMELSYLARNEKFSKKITIEDKLKYFRVNEPWD